MEILAEAGGGRGQTEFFSTHPNPDNRVREIEAAIALAVPDGIPEGLIP
jgi:Zn-dependent protease with chaperone function